MRANVPVYWIADKDSDKSLDPDEVASLLFYPTEGKWVTSGRFTPEFEAAYDTIVTASKAPSPDVSTDEGKRQKLVGDDLDQGRASLVFNDFTALSADDKAFVGHMLRVGSLMDTLYEDMNGAAALAAQLPKDTASQSLFRRNRGPKCVAPATDKDPLCSALPGSPKPIFTLYPAALQKDAKFCDALTKEKNAKDLMAPFVVVRGDASPYNAVPYTEAYKDKMTAISAELTAAADSVKDPTEKPLVDYLRAAATSFTTNDWVPADEAWAKMTVDNSKWYVRVAPDEVYWEPCSQKAGPHLTFARINQGSKDWQSKLVPVQQEMEAAIAQRAGKPYAERKVTFHLPDFIDIVINAGDDRTPLGATIGQSLPNWGPVANEGRGRTVAMVNLYNDPDSRDARRAQAESLFDAASMKLYAGTPEPGLLSTILHEATHNLGPAHEYKVNGKTGPQVFTGPIASVMEELKAQTGALFLIEFLRGKKIIDDTMAAQTYADSIVWAFGHISQGMYDGDGKRKTYSQLAAIQIGFLIEKGALTWDPKATAANGKDTGAFTLHMDKLVPVVDEMMRLVAGIKARGDAAAANALLAKYVDGTVVPHATIKERFLRFPKASFVYALAM
ncbi:MAG TPA: hypothetical protein VFQ53_20855 [Kofleriaceae bacterium]|nr:hypothetical protein [Kofleriaceae bacterium]